MASRPKEGDELRHIFEDAYGEFLFHVSNTEVSINIYVRKFKKWI